MLVYSGNGNRVWNTLSEVGNNGYGWRLYPRWIANGELILEFSNVRSAALLRLNPSACKTAAVRALSFLAPVDWNQAPRLPTYPTSTTTFLLISRWRNMLHCMVL